MSLEEKELFLAAWTVFAIIAIPAYIICVAIFCHSQWVLHRIFRSLQPPMPKTPLK